jgi:argininosuccinate lyase
MALWGGRFEKETDDAVKAFSSSIAVDSQLWSADIRGSMAHANMLCARGVLSKEDNANIQKGLKAIMDEIATGAWTFNKEAEDVHGEIEQRLFEKIGDAAKRMHTARSRNDQVGTSTRLFTAEQLQSLRIELKDLQKNLVSQAERHVESIMPGMTHLQHAQPVSLAHHLLAYFWMFQRDVERLEQSLPRVLSMPLGSAALAGTGFPIDREQTRQELGFMKITENSLDAVSDRDYVIEFLSNASTIMMHLSRFSEELILWSTPEFAFVELGDEVTTGSSIMPQKKNPDVAELIRGRVGRVYGALMGALTMMKGLPLSYNRDMQEDKIHLFEGLKTTRECVRLMELMLAKVNWKTERMAASLKGDFSNATDVADDLVEKGMPFREAHEVVGRLVQWCIKNGRALEDLSVEELKAQNKLMDGVTKAKLAHVAVMNARKSAGGTAPEAVRQQIIQAKKALG